MRQPQQKLIGVIVLPVLMFFIASICLIAFYFASDELKKGDDAALEEGREFGEITNQNDVLKRV
jgi:hypothetical protein